MFIKTDSLWKENVTYLSKDSFYTAANGSRGAKVYGHYRKDTLYYFTRREIHYTTKSRLRIKDKLTQLLLAEDDNKPLFSKASFLTNNKQFGRSVTLKKYTPTQKDIQLIKESFLPYIRRQFATFCHEKSLDTLEHFFADRMHEPIFDTSHVKIERQHSYEDAKQNKIIRFLVPSVLISHGWYPYNEWCAREDSPIQGLRLTCYIDNQDHLIFLQDELTYLDHGDFDDDGKDEFLFWYRIHNHNAYVLYYDDFQKSEKFEWTYH